jgi:hypothetical protein
LMPSAAIIVNSEVQSCADAREKSRTENNENARMTDPGLADIMLDNIIVCRILNRLHGYFHKKLIEGVNLNEGGHSRLLASYAFFPQSPSSSGRPAPVRPPGMESSPAFPIFPA